MITTKTTTDFSCDMGKCTATMELSSGNRPYNFRVAILKGWSFNKRYPNTCFCPPCAITFESGNFKLCNSAKGCGIFLPTSEFSPNGPDSFKANCKKCKRKKKK